MLTRLRNGPNAGGQRQKGAKELGRVFALLHADYEVQRLVSPSRDMGGVFIDYLNQRSRLNRGR